MGHTAPHAPQSRTVSSDVSQPVLALLSQSPKPLAHAAMRHTPATHAGVARAVEHTLPQRPQLRTLSSGVSQPFAGSPSQLPKPGLHAPIAHAPITHAAAAFGKPQRAPHIPQFSAVLRAVSHPGAIVQSPNPGMHGFRQAPLAQTAVVFGRLGHAFVQRPQCAVDVFGSTHAPPHVSRGLVHNAPAHAPADVLHVGVVPRQTSPQRVQFSIVPSVTSQPSAAFVLQSAKPLLHRRTHAPPAHWR